VFSIGRPTADEARNASLFVDNIRHIGAAITEEKRGLFGEALDRSGRLREAIRRISEIDTSGAFALADDAEFRGALDDLRALRDTIEGEGTAAGLIADIFADGDSRLAVYGDSIAEVFEDAKQRQGSIRVLTGDTWNRFRPFRDALQACANGDAGLVGYLFTEGRRVGSEIHAAARTLSRKLSSSTLGSLFSSEIDDPLSDVFRFFGYGVEDIRERSPVLQALSILRSAGLIPPLVGD
jgi:hypothetical protein